MKIPKLPERKRSWMLDPTGSTTGVPGFMRNTATLDRERRKNWATRPDDLFFRSPTRLRSAICAYFVVHAITRIDLERCEVKAKDMTRFLHQEYPQIIWDPISVGKLLGEMSNASKMLEEPAVGWNPERYMPFARLKNQNGYVSYASASPITVFWLHAMLAELEPEALKERDDPDHTAGHGTFGHGNGATAMFNAGARIKQQLIDLNQGEEGLKVLHHQWAMSQQDLLR